MITHVVLFKFKDENKAANIATSIERLRAMVGVVPTLRALEVGRHGAPLPRSLDLALITRFDDQAGLAAYADHPFHVEVKKFLAGVLETSYVVDFDATVD
ncbi:MAG: hypothetical protein JWN04_2730 [Myxococcaceae bacterium]|nr:hypothetical protein [Myxococcaceae bacterium]